jgi:ATP-dependent RNA helicase DeaD
LTSFNELGLSEALLSALSSLGFESPTDIQEKSIPILIKGKCDFIGLAQTGTGKTAAFGLPLLEIVDQDLRATQALVIAPTRELAMQICAQLETFSKHLPKLRLLTIYGGASITQQIKGLRDMPQIVIATPGRLKDMINRRAIKLESVKTVVLDEADEMLNMGFKEEIDEILTFTSKEKQTWLFSATMPREIRQIISQYMTQPVEISINKDDKINLNIEHQFVQVRATDKVEALRRILDFQSDITAVIFCKTKIDTQKLTDDLTKDGIPVEALHGDLSQNQREIVMKRFKAHALKMIVATDVAARGIDVNDLTHVIHFSLPEQAEYYTHRSGRTARAGKKGISLAIITPSDRRKLRFFEDKLKITFKETSVPDVSQIMRNRLQKWAESLLETPKAINITPDALKLVNDTLEGLSHEDLVTKLISLELQKMNIRDTNRDINVTAERAPGITGRKERKERFEKPRGAAGGMFERKGRRESARSGSGSRSGGNSFFINVGTIDDFNPKKLADFVSEFSGIPSKNIDGIRIQNKHSTFTVDGSSAEKVQKSFGRAFVEGRKINVRPDEY